MAYFIYIFIDNNTQNMITYYEGYAGFLLFVHIYT